MSTPTLDGRIGEPTGRLPDPLRALALASVGLLTASYGAVLYEVVNVVDTGSTEQLLAIVIAALLAAGVLARVLRPGLAVALAAVVFAAGLGVYVFSVPNGALLLQSLGAVLGDVVALLTGLSILQITAAGVWVLGFAPAPVFLSWYFAVRERYVAAVAVGGGALGFFVLTGDATLPVALLGAIAAAGAVGFGELARHGGGRGQAENVAIVLGAMVAVAILAPAIPGGAAEPLLGESGIGGGGGPATLETGLIDAGDELSIQGSIDLSPEVRFTVESNRQAYWRTGAYDRYTGEGWVRTGGTRAYSGSLQGPPSNETATVTQQYDPAAGLGAFPAAWKPTEIEEFSGNARVTELGGIRPAEAVPASENYTVRSEMPQTTPEELRRADTDYPEAITDRGYTQLPETTPGWVEDRTSVITRNAENPYDTARTIERWLESTKAYSLNVSRPESNVAATFLAEMEAGYCTYFATAMVTMLRSQDIPARFVTGYTPGQQVAEDRWVVRGLDSHAWVEVYFPEVGWVRFDPTPSGPRTAAEDQRVESARESNASNVDASGSAEGEWTETPTEEFNGSNFTGPDAAQVDTPESLQEALPEGIRANRQPGAVQGDIGNGSNLTPTDGPAGGDDGSGSGGWVLTLPDPSREELALGFVMLFGLGAAARRSGATARAYRAAWLRYRPDGSPDAEVERSFARLEYLLSRRHRPRRPGETPREYIEVVGSDPRVRRVGEVYERARYAGGASREDADEAAGLVDELVGEGTPLLGRLRRLGGGDSI